MANNLYLRVGTDKTNLSSFEIEDIDITYSLKDIKNYGSNNISHSSTIFIPINKQSDLIFKGLHNSTVISDFDISKKLYAEIVKDGIPILIGSLQVLNINEANSTYEVVVYSNEVTLFDKLGEKFIKGNQDPLDDISFSSLYSHVLDPSVVRRYLNASPSDNGSGIFYPIINYNDFDDAGDIQNNYPILPAISAKQLFDKIITDASYSYTISEDISTMMNTMYIPLNNDSLKRDYQYAKYYPDNPTGISLLTDFSIYAIAWRDTVFNSAYPTWNPPYAITMFTNNNVYSFKAKHAAAYLAGGVKLTETTNKFIFTADVSGVNFTGATTFVSNSGNISGTVVNTIDNSTGRVKKVVINFTGTSGTADVYIGSAAEKSASYSGTLSQTAGDFVSDWGAYFSGEGYDITHNLASDTSILVTGVYTNNYSTNVITTSGDLDGTSSTAQTAVAAVARVDTITWSGTTGDASITCDALTKNFNIKRDSQGYDYFRNPIGQTADHIPLPFGNIQIDASLEFGTENDVANQKIVVEYWLYDTEHNKQILKNQTTKDATVVSVADGSTWINSSFSFYNDKVSYLYIATRPEDTSLGIEGIGTTVGRTFVFPVWKLSKGSSIEITLKDTIYSNRTININDILPTGYKQKDFVKDIFKLFNAYVSYDNYSNSLDIKSYSEYYNPSVKDWTNKIVSDSIKISPVKNELNKNINLKYKEGTDSYNIDFKNKYDYPFGSKIIVNDSDFVSGNNNIELNIPSTIEKEISGTLPVIIPPDASLTFDVSTYTIVADPSYMSGGYNLVYGTQLYTTGFGPWIQYKSSQQIVHGSPYLNVKSNTYWTTEVARNGCSIIPASGFGDTSCYITIEKNILGAQAWHNIPAAMDLDTEIWFYYGITRTYGFLPIRTFRILNMYDRNPDW